MEHYNFLFILKLLKCFHFCDKFIWIGPIEGGFRFSIWEGPGFGVVLDFHKKRAVIDNTQSSVPSSLSFKASLPPSFYQVVIRHDSKVTHSATKTPII